MTFSSPQRDTGRPVGRGDSGQTTPQSWWPTVPVAQVGRRTIWLWWGPRRGRGSRLMKMSVVRVCGKFCDPRWARQRLRILLHEDVFTYLLASFCVLGP